MLNSPTRGLATILMSAPCALASQKAKVRRTMVTFSWMIEVDTDCCSVPALSNRAVWFSSAILLLMQIADDKKVVSVAVAVDQQRMGSAKFDPAPRSALPSTFD